MHLAVFFHAVVLSLYTQARSPPSVVWKDPSPAAALFVNPGFSLRPISGGRSFVSVLHRQCDALFLQVHGQHGHVDNIADVHDL